MRLGLRRRGWISYISSCAGVSVHGPGDCLPRVESLGRARVSGAGEAGGCTHEDRIAKIQGFTHDVFLRVQPPIGWTSYEQCRQHEPIGGCPLPCRERLRKLFVNTKVQIRLVVSERLSRGVFPRKPAPRQLHSQHKECRSTRHPNERSSIEVAPRSTL